jgi:hypothetical protein
MLRARDMSWKWKPEFIQKREKARQETQHSERSAKNIAALNEIKEAYVDSHKDDYRKECREYLAIGLVLLTVIFTGLSYWVFDDQLIISRDAEQRDLRAYVTASEVLVAPTTNKNGGDLMWMIMPKWQNAGRTPTRWLRGYVRCVYFDVSGKMTETNPGPTGTHDIGPTQIAGVGACNIAPANIISKQAAGLINGAWSTLHYTDVFGKPHVSQQCVG